MIGTQVGIIVLLVNFILLSKVSLSLMQSLNVLMEKKK